jgi:hypothetical protein
MNREHPEIVTASEIASWAWCPESWRLDALGAEPGNRDALHHGTRHHRATARAERWAMVLIRLGAWLVIAALLLAAAAFLLARG